MITPLGIKLAIGQTWQECDKRFTRFVRITGWDSVSRKVRLDGKTWAKISRFNGKNSGYKPIIEAQKEGK